MNERLDPLEDLVGEEFVDREYELNMFWEWAQKIPRGQSRSFALIGRRRMGKTAILVRLFNRLFWEQDEVVPIYYSLAHYMKDSDGPGEELTTLKFCEEYIQAQVRCYLAFRHREPDLVSRAALELPALRELASKWGEEEMVKVLDILQSYLERERVHASLITLAIDHPRHFAYGKHIPTAVMIDEFQVLTDVYDPVENVRHNITGNFQWAAETRWAPMIVAGSAIHTISERALGGLLTARFMWHTVPPLSQKHTYDLVMRLGQLYNIKANETTARVIWERTGGYPYYIRNIIMSKSGIGRDLTDLDQLEEVILFELTNSDAAIYKFLTGEFQKYTRLNQAHIARHILYWSTKYPDQRIDPDRVAEAVGLAGREEVDRILELLYQVDLVDKHFGYKGLTDPLLREFIEMNYKQDVLGLSRKQVIADWKAEYDKLRGRMSNFVGEVAEVYIKAVMEAWRGEEVDGAEYFNHPGLLTLPRFEAVEQRGGIVEKGVPVELDLLGAYDEGKRAWLMESKYWQEEVDRGKVEEFLAKAEQLQSQTGYQEMTLWYFSRQGFHGPAEDALREAGVLYSDLAQFNKLARRYGFTGLPKHGGTDVKGAA